MTEDSASNDTLDSLVRDWMTLPDVAAALGVSVGQVRGLVAERRVVGVKRGRPATFQIPRRFIVPEHLADPANLRAPLPGDGQTVLSSLQGTVTVLTDGGLDDAEIVRWLFADHDVLGGTPIDTLLAGHKARVRQAGQLLG